jgi:hypothetical protein
MSRPPRFNEKKVLAKSIHLQQPRACHALLSQSSTSELIDLFQTWENNYSNIENAQNCLWE